MQPCTKCFGQCSCFVDVHFLTLTGVSRHDQVRNCVARSVHGLCAGGWGIASKWDEVKMSLRLYFGVNLLLLYFTNLADCCHCGVHFHRADNVHAVKNTPPFLLWIGSVCLHSVQQWGLLNKKKNGFHFENLLAKSKALRPSTQLQYPTGVFLYFVLVCQYILLNLNLRYALQLRRIVVGRYSENDVYAGTCSQFAAQTNANRTAVLTQICTDCWYRNLSLGGPIQNVRCVCWHLRGP